MTRKVTAVGDAAPVGRVAPSTHWNREVMMRWRFGEGIAAGLLALLFSLVPYVSAQRQVFGRWSYTFAGLLALLLLAVLVGARAALAEPREQDPEADPPVAGARWAAIGLDLGVALWGAGYLIGSIFEPGSRGRLLHLDLFQSVVPAASMLEWAGLAAAVAGVALFIWMQLSAEHPMTALTLCGVLGVLVLGEGGARWMAAYHPRPTWTSTAASERWDRRYVDLNLRGYRDREHPLAAPEGIHRLLVVGGSEAFGAGVDSPDLRFSEELAAQLSSATGRTWEAINVGLRGADAAAQFRGLRDGLDHAPEVVVLLDSFDEPGWSGEEPAAGHERTHSRTWRVLATNSVLFQEVALRVAPPEAPPPAVTPAAAPVPRSTDERIAAMRRFVATASAPGRTVVIIPVDVEISTDVARRNRYRAFVRQADSLGLPVWSVERAFRGQEASALVVSATYREPNALAHQLMALEVAGRLALQVRRPEVPVMMFMP